MTTATKTKPASKSKPDVRKPLAKLEGAWAKAEKRHQDLSRDLTEKREILHGPTFDANVGGAIEQLQALRQRDPAQFKTSGEAVGPDAKKLQAKIDEVGDLDSLAAEVEHTRLLADKAGRDLKSYVTAHALEILDAKRPQFEGHQAALAAALDRLRQALDDYSSGCREVSGLLGAAGLGTRVPGEEEVSGLRRDLKHVIAPPVPIPDDLDGEV